ncbi:MAG: hypothetical protein V4732_17775 [Pseudomonadota bacterium]
MKNKRFWLPALAISIGAIAFYNFNTLPDTIATTKSDTGSVPKDLAVYQTDMTNMTLPLTLPSSAQSSSQKESKTYARLQDRLEAMRERRPNLQFDPVAVEAAVNRQHTWENAKKLPTHLPLKPEEFTDGRQFIQLDSLKIETLMPGDSVKVSIIDSGEHDYNVIMDSIEKHDYNSISWHGHIDGKDGQTYQVSFTRGEKLTLGGLDTPEGHYVLQAHGNDGWIASSKILFKIDPNHTDEVYPTEDKLDP